MSGSAFRPGNYPEEVDDADVKGTYLGGCANQDFFDEEDIKHFGREDTAAAYDRWFRKVKAEAWREGHKAAWQESGDGWNGEVNGIGDYEEILRRGCFQDNPYEREEDQ